MQSSEETVQSATNRWRYDGVPLHNNVAMMRSSEVRERVRLGANGKTFMTAPS
jgi:hypothetical protein